MKNLCHRILASLMIAALFISVLPVNTAFAASKESADSQKEVTISSSSVTLTVGETFTVSLNNASGTRKWKSKKTSIATVGKKTGLITAVAPGKTTVYCTYKDVKYTCKVTVVAPTIAKVIKVGESCTLNIPGTKTSDKWTSDNTAYATVSKGVVKGVSIGLARITATDKSGEERYGYVAVVPASDFKFKYRDSSYGEVEEIKHSDSITYNILYSNDKIHYNAQLTPDKAVQFVNEWNQAGKNISAYNYGKDGKLSNVTYAVTSDLRANGPRLELYVYYSKDIIGMVELREVSGDVHTTLKLIDFDGSGCLSCYQEPQKDNPEIQTIIQYNPSGDIFRYSEYKGDVEIFARTYFEDRYQLDYYDEKTDNLTRSEYYYYDGSSLISLHDPATGNCYKEEYWNPDGLHGINVYDPSTGRIDEDLSGVYDENEVFKSITELDAQRTVKTDENAPAEDENRADAEENRTDKE